VDVASNVVPLPKLMRSSPSVKPLAPTPVTPRVKPIPIRPPKPNAVSLQSLLAEADQALKLVKEAEATAEVQVARRAYRAYKEIIAKRPGFSFATPGARALDVKLEHIRTRLKRLGPKVDSGE
jgi:hypothetical protein